MSSKTKRLLLHSSLFIATFITTTMAGAQWTYNKSAFISDFSWNTEYSWADFVSGFPYSISFLLILTAHEFGHYFTAIYNRVKTTLPYYIPLPFFFGTLGALIRIKSMVHSKQQHFDIGIAGPLAGFVMALIILLYGFTHLPPPEYIFQFHPDYEQFGLSYSQFVYSPEFMKPGTADILLGKNLMFSLLEKVADPARVPNAHEIIHYPILFAGYLSLIFTCLNLIPIGQLDGGHVLYGLAGYTWHRRIASGIFIVFLFYAGLGLVRPSEARETTMLFETVNIPSLLWKIPATILFLYACLTGLKLHWKNTLTITIAMFTVQYLLVMMVPTTQGYSGWLLFAFIVGRFAGIPHPPSPIEEPLTTGRKILGWIALLIFILCFTPDPLQVIAVQ
jgi:membrane-associated protease RseP (regulator of RpoE activity)